MKLTKTTTLLLSSLLVFGCNDSSDDGDGDTGDTGSGGSSYSQSVLITDTDSGDTGELQLELGGSAYSTGTLSVNVRMSTDETETVLIGIYSASGVSNANKIAEIKLDEGYTDAGDDMIGVQLRGDGSYDKDNGGTSLTDINADTWVNFELTWDSSTTPGTYSVSIDDVSLGTFNYYDNDLYNDNIDDAATSNNASSNNATVGFMSIKLSSNSGTAASSLPLYVDDLTITGDSSYSFSDNFESYDVDYELGTGVAADDSYKSSTSEATISDAQNATE